MYPPIVPYLAVRDAAAAIDFYIRAFGAEEKLRVPGENGRGIMHAEVRIGAGTVMLTDPAPSLGFNPPAPGERAPVGIMVALPTPAEVDALFRRATEAGGEPETEPRDEPWGARFAGIVDPWGHRWWLHAPLQAAGNAP
jgi:PhnB protein